MKKLKQITLLKQPSVAILVVGVLICWFYSSVVAASPFERRRDQFQNTPGFLFLPLPYSIPGVGEGTFLIGSANNVFKTSTDLLLLGFTGDAEGYYGSINELFLIPDFLYLSVNKGTAAKFGQNIYSSRGMDNEKKDFNIFVGEDFKFGGYDAIFTLFERRLELTYGVNTNDGKFVEIRDSDGELIQELDGQEVKSSQAHIQLEMNITDDYNDPRSGLNIRLIQEHFSAQNDGDPEYNTLTKSLTLYVPLLEESTLLFHYFRSDAIVLTTGNTDLESLKEEKGFSSCGGDAACESAVLNSAENQLNANKNGTARGVGGSARLRSYPLNRYQAAHTSLYGAEFRWNFSTKGGKLDWFFLKDIVDSFQAAFFMEQASVSEEEEDLGNIVRNSYGAGLRFVGQSGSVYRLDLATGDEGSELNVIFEYPWGGTFD